MSQKTISLAVRLGSAAALVLLAIGLGTIPATAQQSVDPTPPTETIKLIFIHHSTGENWLRNDYGGLGQALADNNYFVSDTNYGWGPDSIGDSTDIPNWTDWFASERTAVYMDALLNESEQHSEYSRLANDPGGENRIILFKSCFPNSGLEGSPDDQPDPEGWLSVGHAKYVYNQILPFFAAHPERLFIVITAPPLSDGEYSENARAFNNWLVNDWLDENNYALTNVAVFDFYNILTAESAHHFFQDGSIQHIVGSRNTLHYPSGDDHPSDRGSRKATEEFLPLLNIFYNRWVASGDADLPPEETADPADAGQTSDVPGSGVPLPPEVLFSIDDFDSGKTWESFSDAATASTISCTTEPGAGRDGSSALRMEFSITTGSWGTCALFFDTPQDWSQGDFLAYDVHGSVIGLPYSVAVYSGSEEARQTHIQYRETPVNYPDGFIEFTAAWNELLRVEWEEAAGTPFDAGNPVLGISFGVEGQPETTYSGTILIDNTTIQKYPDYDNSGNNSGQQDDGSKKPLLPCMSILIFPLLFLGLVFLNLRK